MHNGTCGDWWFDLIGSILRYWLREGCGWSIGSVFKEAGVKMMDGSVRITSEAVLCVNEDLLLSKRILALPPRPCPSSNKALSPVRNRVVITGNNIEYSTRVG